MKIVHISDTHLGRRELHHTDAEGRNVREQDGYRVFAEAIDKALELEPAAVVHSGDLFHGYHPASAALGAALDQIERLRAAGIEFAVVAGNHSTPRGRAIAHPFSLLERFGVDAVHAQPRRLRFGELAVTAVPHSHDHEKLAGWIAAAEPDPEARFNVLAAHLGLEGLARVGAGEPGAAELPGEILESVAGFDYIALGHLHQFDRPRVNAVYAGSLERLSWADHATRKGIVEVDLAAEPMDRAFLRLHELEGRPRLRLPAIDGSGSGDLTKEICKRAKGKGLEDAIVRLPIANVGFEKFGAVDRRKVGEAFERCLHFELEPEFAEPGSGAPQPVAPAELRDFLAQRVPAGAEPEAFVARGESFMTRAAEDIGA
ncbi:MAG TPA: exonuclease SbcCD subunit D [Solirubrobacterales bacterium]|nr:exonuclease SbcCD subunit D [Solirubrobacterales bacterium]